MLSWQCLDRLWRGLSWATALTVVCSALLPLPGWLLDRLLVVTVTISVITVPLALSRLHLRWLPLTVLATALLRLGLLAQLSRALLGHSPVAGWATGLGRLAMGDVPLVGLSMLAILMTVQWIVASGCARMNRQARFAWGSDLCTAPWVIDYQLTGGEIDEQTHRHRMRLHSRQVNFYQQFELASMLIRSEALAVICLGGGLALGCLGSPQFALPSLGLGVLATFPSWLAFTAMNLALIKVTAVTHAPFYYWPRKNTSQPMAVRLAALAIGWGKLAQAGFGLSRPGLSC